MKQRAANRGTTNRSRSTMISLLASGLLLLAAGEVQAIGFGSGSFGLIEQHVYDKAFEAQKEREQQRQKQLEEARRDAEKHGYHTKERQEISTQSSLKHTGEEGIQ